MKSEHRHELETNSLARHLTKWIDSGMPYGQTVLFGLLGILLAWTAWSWYGKTTASQQGRAWFDYNLAVEGYQPNLDLLKKAADDHPGTPVGELSELTWADGQLFLASQVFLNSKTVANEYLDAAAGQYESVISTVRDPLLVSRAHWGLGRVYEMRADLEKATGEYEKVTGPFEPLAKQRLEQLKNSQAGETLTWLASAEVPRTPVPSGSGTPGVRPEFRADEFGMPTDEPTTEATVDDIIKRLQGLGLETESSDRYTPPGDQPPPGVTDEKPAEGPQLPQPENPPAAEDPAAESPSGDTPSEETPAEEKPAEEKPATEAEAPQP